MLALAALSVLAACGGEDDDDAGSTSQPQPQTVSVLAGLNDPQDPTIDTEQAHWLDEGRAAKRTLNQAPPRSERAADGTTTWRIEMGATTEQDPTSPQVAAPAPGPSPQTLNATDLFNTGLLPPNAPPGSGPPEPARSFTFVVPTAGTYSYVCILHAPSSMAGSIKVA